MRTAERKTPVAMTKKEAAEVERIKEELRLKGALRATSPVEPDVPIPTSCRDENLAKGYLFVCSNLPRIEKACSSSIFHSCGNDDKTTTQGARMLYSTPLRAALALRYETEQECAQRLAKVDEMIEKLRHEDCGGETSCDEI